MRTRNIVALACVFTLAVSVPALASSSYTPSQLRQMVGSGNAPDQQSPTSKSQSISFSACVAKVRGVIASVQPQYPAKTVVNTSLLFMAKVWTNDAALTLTCSGPDRKLVITTAKYR